MFDVIITHTGKGVREPDMNEDGRSNYRVYDEEKKSFASIEAAKAWVKMTYGKLKRKPIYIDEKGASTRIGWVFHIGKTSDMSHAMSEDNQPWIQEDWVAIHEVAITHPKNWRL